MLEGGPATTSKRICSEPHVVYNSASLFPQPFALLLKRIDHLSHFRTIFLDGILISYPCTQSTLFQFEGLLKQLRTQVLEPRYRVPPLAPFYGFNRHLYHPVQQFLILTQ